MSVIISTGDIKSNYQIIDVIFATDSHGGGITAVHADPSKAFAGVKKQLEQKCKSLKGDAVINCQFEYRVAVVNGLMSKKQVFEIFAYGTAVKLT